MEQETVALVEPRETGETTSVSQAMRARTSAKRWLTRAENTLETLLEKSETSVIEIEVALVQFEKRNF